MKTTTFLTACGLLCACGRLPTPVVTAEPQRAAVGEQVQIHVTIPSETGISFRNSTVEFSVTAGGIFSDAFVAVPDEGMVTSQLTAHTASRYEVTAVFSFFEHPGSSGTTVVEFF